jgi:uncharacterized Zn-binding protein involved in type VI secretion
MPGPPAPFVPTPLPNIGKSNLSPDGYSKDVTIEGKAVAIKGATFKSMGDIASKGTGGGIVSANCEGPTAFVAPGSMDVKIEGKNVQLLGDATMNNNGSPPNASSPATMQAAGTPVPPSTLAVKCADAPAGSEEKMSPCEKKQICAKCADVNKQAKEGKLSRSTRTPEEAKKARAAGNNAAKTFKRRQGNLVLGIGEHGKKIPNVAPADMKDKFAHDCAHQEWMDAEADPKMPGLSADHIHEIQLGGSPTDASNLRMMSSKANEWMGRTLQDYDPSKHSGVSPDCCD